MASRAMDRSFAATYRKLIAIQKSSPEQLCSRSPLDYTRSICQIRSLKTVCKKNNLINAPSHYNLILSSKLLSVDSSKGILLQNAPSKIVINSENYSLLALRLHEIN